MGLFCCFFFFFFFGRGGGVGGSGTPWVVTCAISCYYQIILVVYGIFVILGEGTNHHYSFL